MRPSLEGVGGRGDFHCNQLESHSTDVSCVCFNTFTKDRLLCLHFNEDVISLPPVLVQMLGH